MAILRHAKFYRNTNIANYDKIQNVFDDTNGVIARMEAAKSGLQDGEIILGRFTIGENGSGGSGTIIGVARVVNGNVSLDYLLDRTTMVFMADTIASQRISQIQGSQTIVSKTTENNMTKYSFGTVISQTNGLNTITGSEDLYFKTQPTSSNYIVTESDLSGIVGAMYYKGTVNYANSQLTPSPSATSVTSGDVYIASSDFTLPSATQLISGNVPAGNYEAGDMFIYNGSSWNVVSGENQYVFNPTTVAVGASDFTTIGTIDGGAIQIKVTDSYSTLSAKLDADDLYGDDLVTPTDDFRVLNSIVEENGVLTMGTAYNLKKLAATGAASDASITAISGLTSTNVQDALEELAGNATSDNTTINNLHGNFTVGSTLVTVDNNNRVLDVRIDTTYLGTASDGSIYVSHVDTDGDSANGGDLATVNTVQTYISTEIAALDGLADAEAATGVSANGPVKVLRSVVEEDGVISVGTAYTLSTVASTGHAADIAIEDSHNYFDSNNVEDALAELYTIATEAAHTTSSVSNGDGITISSSTSSGNTDYNVAVNLSAYSLSTDTNEYNTGVSNLLKIATDGKLSVSDTWDCGTY